MTRTEGASTDRAGVPTTPQSNAAQQNYGGGDMNKLIEAAELALKFFEDMGHRSDIGGLWAIKKVLSDALDNLYEEDYDEWVGLTDEERNEILMALPGGHNTHASTARAIEAALKEKNT